MARACDGWSAGSTTGARNAPSFELKAKAERHWKEVSSSQITGEYVDPRLGQITLASFYRDWSKRQIWVRGTRLGMDRTIAQVTFADVPLTELRQSHWEEWVKEMTDRPLKPLTINSYYMNARAVYNAARREQLVARDIGDRVKLPRQPRAEELVRCPTPEEAKRLRDAVPPEFEAFISVMLFAGLRRGEAEGLQVGDIDWRHKLIKVRRQVQGTCAENLKVCVPKTEGSVRDVHVSDAVIAMMAEHIRLFVPGDDPERWMFVSKIRPGARLRGWHGAGKFAHILAPNLPLHGSAVDYMWSNARKAAGVNYRLHDLRHYFATGLIAAGNQATDVAKAMGHDKIETTLSTYAHLWPNSGERVRAGVEKLVEWTLGG